MKVKTVVLFVLAAVLLAGSAPAAMTHTAATLDTRADVLKEALPESTPVTLETDDDGQLVIVLSADIPGGLTLPADLGPVTIDLNGWSIRGRNGDDGDTMTAGENGGAAITVDGTCGADAGDTAITLTSPSVATVYTDENGFDTTPEGTPSSTTYVPGDYCIIDLATGETTIWRNVTDPTIFNVDEYKTTKMVFRYVPEGKFKAKTSQYTSEPYTGVSSYDMELSAYWIGLFELTEAQYNMLKGTPGTGSTKAKVATDKGNLNAIIIGTGVGFAEKRNLSGTYLKALNDKIAASEFANKIDVCTQCQWERAARAGTRSDYFFSEDPLSSTTVANEVKAYGWFNDSNYSDGVQEIQKVGLLRPNAWGLWDVYGNAADTCIDTAANMTLEDLPKDWVDEGSHSYRIARGGYINSELAKSLSSVVRSRASSIGLGCRLVLNAESPAVRCEVIGGNGGDGNPAGKGSPAIAYADGTELVPTVIGDNINVIHGKDGKSLGFMSVFWITDHADAGPEKVHLAFQPIFAKPVDMAVWIPDAYKNGLIHYVAADTEAELANAPLKDDFTLRGGTGTQDAKKGWCWITVPATNKLYKVVIVNDNQLGGVQLWKDGPFFAECNVGATTPEDPGYYFWWGDTIGYIRNGSKWNAADKSTMNFSFAIGCAPTAGQDDASLKANGWIGEDGCLVAAHDAATAYLGAPWRMPTPEDLHALTNNCTLTWTTQNNVLGCLVKGKGDYALKSIFLPASGIGVDTDLQNHQVWCVYWASRPSSAADDSVYHAEAWNLYFDNQSRVRVDAEAVRRLGRCVRPIRDATK